MDIYKTNHHYACMKLSIEPIHIVDNQNTLFLTKIVVPKFVFWDFVFKVCNAAWIMPSFGKWFIFIHFYLEILR